ncbi:MAG: RraA family protein [Betaproteobacteria bacterium]
MDVNLVARCRAIATSTWSDALDAAGLEGVIQGLTRRSGGGRLAGPAVTVRESAAGLGDHSAAAFDVGAILDAAGTGCVLAIDLGGAEVSALGGLAADAAVRRGVAGAAIDGGCRDLEAIQAAGLWVSSRHVTPLTGRGRVRVEAINQPVSIGGVVVRPGDWIVGDETGLIRIEAAHLAELLGRAEALEARDRQFETALRRGERFGDVARRLGHL